MMRGKRATRAEKSRMEQRVREVQKEEARTDGLNSCINPAAAREIRRRHCRPSSGGGQQGALLSTDTFSGAWVLARRRPCVYLLWRGEECLYVGMSENGLVRPLAASHERIGAELHSDDELQTLSFDDRWLALEIEYWLIPLFRPIRPSFSATTKSPS